MVNWATKRQLVHRADNLVTLICQLSGNLGASTSWNPKGSSRLVQELCLYYVGYNEFV